jgi:DNA-binding response OmpR family regulator
MSNRTARLRVLVVEDCLDTAEALRAVLVKWGHDVRTAQDGTAGMNAATVFRPDVALIDLGLPGPDGFQLARWLQGLPKVPVLVAATGHDSPVVRLAATETGFDHFLPKPFNLEQLQAVVEGGTAPRPPARAGGRG